MPVPAAPGIVALEAIWTQEDQNVENTYHYKLAGTISTGVLTSIINSYTAWATLHTGLFHNACQLVKVNARDLSSSAGASVEYNVSPPIQGTGGAGAMPNNVTIAIKRQTGLRGRRYRGRLYWVGMSDIHLQTGAQMVVAAYADNLVLACNDLLSREFTENAAKEVIYHKDLGTGTDVTSYVYTDLDVDSQRRRLPGHNRHH